ncbi:phage holin [Salinicoccus roseus]|uniref:phage holin n=1 Tax=Salinicoccus roseus TaxID=45670 RepID=UPI002301E893|nr:phage holin [Salinicoccus roseus]
MKINWKVRLQKKSFWVAIVSALIVATNSIAGAFGYDVLPVTQEIEAIVMTLLNVLVLAGVIEDMTTRGYEDSDQAMTYGRPKKDGIE